MITNFRSLAIVCVWLFLGFLRGSYASSLVEQTQLDGTCIPKFMVSLPVFGPGGSVPRVDAASHPNLTVTMEEIEQAVLPQGYASSCGVTLGKTRVWAFKTQDTRTEKVLGPTRWPGCHPCCEAQHRDACDLREPVAEL